MGQSMENPYPIDFVILWVDGNNPEWQARYKQYRTENHPEDTARYRDWGLLPYWFRAVEKYAPWVNKIYFVTSGELPDWLNLDYPKLVHVKHEDFIPAKYLPTFSARTVNLNLHLIPGLSEHFVYFDDDIFLNGPVKPTYFFRKGLPCDAPCEGISCSAYYSKKNLWGTDILNLCNMGVINTHFDRYQSIKSSPWRWFGWYVNLKYVINAVINSRTQRYQCFGNNHNAQPYLKSTYEDAWEKESYWLDKSCSYKFRQDVSLNQWFLRYWQLAENHFYPFNRRYSLITFSDCTQVKSISEYLDDEKYKCICLNDTPLCGDKKYEELRPLLRNLMNAKFPPKSRFEK
jgi:hypothetical protein